MANKKDMDIMDETGASIELSDKIDLLKYVAEVQSSVKRKITSDFVMCKLEKKDKEAIIEMTSNAYFSYKLMTILALRSKTWIWNEKKQAYDHVLVGKEIRNYILKIGSEIFDSYIRRLEMCAILNRNVDKNYIVNVLAEYRPDESMPEEVAGGNENDMVKKMKDLLKNQDKGDKND